MARSDALRETALRYAREAQELLDADDGSPRVHAQVEAPVSKSERLMTEYAQVRAAEAEARGPRPSGLTELRVGGAMPFGSGRDPGRASTRRSYHGVSWADSVLDTVSATNRTAFNAALLTAGSTAVAVPLNPNPVRIGARTDFLRSLIPEEDAPGGQFSYMQQTVRTNNAAVVAPGGLKPTSVHTTARVNDHTRMVATLSEPVNRVDIDDASLLRQFLDAELALDLDLATDDAILNGLGTGDLITGVLVQSGVQTAPFATDKITSIRKGLTKLRVSELVPDGIVMNPTEWEAIELAAMATFAAKDSIGTPVDPMTRTLFGIPVVESNAIAAGTAVVGAWGTSSFLYTTGGVQIDWSQESYDPNALGAGVGATDFSRNLIRWRVEQRLQVAWTRPAGFVIVTLAAA